MNNSNLGIRIGAAGHFASRIVAAAVNSGQVSYNDAAAQFANLTADCFVALNDIEDSYAPTPAATLAAVASTPPSNEAALQQLHAMSQDRGNTIVAPAPTFTGGNPEIVGDQHGELPAWLAPICQKYGIAKVFDNRDQLAEKSTRPHFRQAGLPKGSRDAKGLWPDTK
tara:strand:- start:177 stop:680 length:504 start_codon:yes stop_codon:yes gene_type:complete